MSPTIASLSRLVRVDVKEVWKHEAEDFTPWLAEDDNLRLLGETLGMELELEAVEVGVGNFSADIVASDTADGSKVVIENQLEKTDHSHLGQILTYAAGLHALKVVWIARRFTDEHRAALEWLNENTRENIRFFGLEIEVWKIDSSPPAPKFNIVVQPNDWTKSQPTTELTPTKKAQLDFWRGFVDHAKEHASNFCPTAPQPAAWMSLAIGKTDFGLQAIASSWGEPDDQPELRAEFVLYRHKAAGRYKTLEGQRAQIEEEFEFGDDRLVWQESADTILRKIYCRTQVPNWLDEGQREASYQWLTERLDRLHEIFRDRIATLD